MKKSFGHTYKIENNLLRLHTYKTIIGAKITISY